MRNEDASQAGLNSGATLNARDDIDHLAAADYGPATGNAISGSGTVTGATGTDMVGSAQGRITAIEGAGGSDSSFSGGKLEVQGQYGKLTIDAQGNYSYERDPGTPAGVSDVFTYTLANKAGATDAAKLIINIGDVPMLAGLQGARVVPGPDGVVTLPPGVSLSDVRVVGRDLVVTLPDGSTMIIVDGAIFVPRLVIDGVEVPASNLAALLIDSEPRPAAGDLTPAQQSSGGNFEQPVPPLDPGVPLGDLLPPTELDYTPPEFEEIGDALKDNDPPVVLGSAIAVSEEGLPAGLADDNPGPPQDTTNLAVRNGTVTISDPDGDALVVTLAAPPEGLTSKGVAITWVLSNGGHLLTGSAGSTTVITISITDAGAYTVTLLAQIDHPAGNGENTAALTIPVTVSDGEEIATGSIAIQLEDDSPNASGAQAASSITFDETAAVTPAGFPKSVTSADPMIAGIAGAFGADGPAASNSQVLGLALTGGVSSLASGMFTSAGHQAITLVQTNATTITGTYGAGSVAFTLVINANGTVTYTQNVPLDHVTDGSDAIAFNDTNTPLTFAGLVNATVTLTDFDGDSASASVPIGDRIRIFDDGPANSVNADFRKPVLVVDESPVAAGEDGVSSSSASFAGAFGAATAFGADGAGTVAYKFVLGANTATGLYALDPADTETVIDPLGKGAQILLFLEADGSVTGRTVAGGTVYFTIAVDGSGTVTLTRGAANLWHDDVTNGDDPEVLSAAAGALKLVKTVSDADGDSAAAEIDLSNGVFNIEDDGPAAPVVSTQFNETLVVDESPVGADEGGDNAPPGDRSDSKSFAGAFATVVAGSFGTDGPLGGTLAAGTSYRLVLSAEGANSGLYALDPTDTVATPGDGIGQGAQIQLFTAADGSIEGRVGGAGGTLYFTISVSSTGVVTFTQVDGKNVWHGNTGSDDDTSSLVVSGNTLKLEQTLTDADGDKASSLFDLSNGVFNIEDDGPSNGVGIATGAVGEDTLPGGIADIGDTKTLTTGLINLAGLVDFGTDGAGSLKFDSSLLAALTAQNLSSGTAPLKYSVSADGLTLTAFTGASAGTGTDIFKVTLSGTNATFLLIDQIDHTGANLSLAGDDQIKTIDLGGVIRAYDADGDSVVLTGSAFKVTIEDDIPITYEPQNASLTNAAGAAIWFDLDDPLQGGDDNILNNFGADGPGTVRFQASLNSTDSGLTSGSVKIWYFLDATQTILTGKVGATALAAASGATIFTVTIDTANSRYSVDMNGKVDAFTEIVFNPDDFDLIGGNKGWFGITQAAVADSTDILITPNNGSSVNTSNILGGVGAGQSVDTGEFFRIDYVTDLTGSPPNNYTSGGTNGHSFDGHYITNGASVNFRQSGGTTLKFTASEDADGNQVVGDGVIELITGIVIEYNGGQSAILAPTNVSQNVIVGGRTFSYVLDADGKSVIVGNIGGASGNSGPPETQVAIFTADGYNSLQVSHAGGESIKFSGFAAAVPSTDPVLFALPTEIVDGDGDVVSGGDIDISLTPPVVLDLDGDGVEFLDRSAGVAYDYGNGIVATAWAAADDAILVRDANSNGNVDDATEFVFGGNGLTDMEALRAHYGDTLDAKDADFAQFKVWQDANSNGKVDDGELVSLSDAGIASISLVSDGQSYTAANGDVVVAGSSSYTRTDGSTGTAADALFATGAAKSTQEIERVAANSNNTVLAAAVAAAGLAAAAPAAASSPADGGDQLNAVVAIEAAPVALVADGGTATAVGALMAGSMGIDPSLIQIGNLPASLKDADPIVGQLSGDVPASESVSETVEATDAATPVPAPTAGADVALASVEMLAAMGGDEGAKRHAIVEKIVAEALDGGGAADLDALLNALPAQENGGTAGLEVAASLGDGAVSNGDSGHMGAFTMAAIDSITTEAIMLHHDALQPVANG